MRACLFHPADAEQADARHRLAGLLQSAAADAPRRDVLRAAAPVETATHAALLQDWVGCASHSVHMALMGTDSSEEGFRGLAPADKHLTCDALTNDALSSFFCTCSASAAVEDGWNVFREQWAALHPLSHTRRRVALDILQPLAEVQVCQSRGCSALSSLQSKGTFMIH